MPVMMDKPIPEREQLSSLIPALYSGPEADCLHSVLMLKNMVIGSNKQKEVVLQAGVVPRLLHLFTEDSSDGQLVYEIGALLCSLSKGTSKHVRLLVDSSTIQTLIKKLGHLAAVDANQKLVEICLRTLRSLFLSQLAPVQTLYSLLPSGLPFVAYLVNLASPNYKGELTAAGQASTFTAGSTPIPTSNCCVQECVLNILSAACQTADQQNLLCEYSCLQTVSDLLLLNAIKVNRPALQLLAKLTHRNELVSMMTVSTVSRRLLPAEDRLTSRLADRLSYQLGDRTGFPAGYTANDRLHYQPGFQLGEQLELQRSDVRLLDLLYALLGVRDTQLEAARCIAFLHRANALGRSPPNRTHEQCIQKTLRVLARLCKSEQTPEVRIQAANILAYLTEVDADLQRTSAICDHIILTLSEYFRFGQANSQPEAMDRRLARQLASDSLSSKKLLREEELKLEMREAAFMCFASLSASDHEIRKKIISTEQIMEHTVNGLSDPSPRIRLAALRCLHSLSRSVQQLRTTFQDHAAWIPLKTLLLGTTDDSILSLVSSTLCNLLLEFSPSKQHFLDRGALDLLCSLTKREQPALRLNGIWALMNMAFQAEQPVKMQILGSLGMEQLFALLNDAEADVQLKTLGLIRNLLSTKSHIDHIMSLHGKHIVEAVLLMLDGAGRPQPTQTEVREQTVCILANIANGDTAKEFIMQNEVLLSRLIACLKSDCSQLQAAAVCCVNNLIWNSESGAAERQAKLKQLGVYKLLQQLLESSNDQLFARVKTALQQYEKDN